ncbi:MAG: hypothetical protein JNK66_07590 [Chitinophagales bacterium]|nr:hypothetical protein [Chitinophagales bacterium]
MDIILVTILSSILYRNAKTNGLSPLRYLLNFLAAFLLIEFLIGYTLINMYGKDILKSEEGMRTAVYMQPLALGLVTLLFFYFRKQIINEGKQQKSDEDNTPPPPPSAPKKDLSYFR